MFERFTDRARKVIVLAQEVARAHGSEAIGVDHLAIGIIDEGEGVGFKILDRLLKDVPDLRTSLVDVLPQPLDEPLLGHIPFTSRAKKVIELSLKEALQLGHPYIGTEHLLLAILREGESAAAKLLTASGVHNPAVREQLVLIFNAKGQPTRPEGMYKPNGEPYPEQVQHYVTQIAQLSNLTEGEVRVRLRTVLEAVSADAARQARHAVAKDTKAYLDLLSGG